MRMRVVLWDWRQERLRHDEVMTLYHQTSTGVADIIREGGGRLLRGSGGIAGGGLYFAFSPRETELEMRA